MLTIDRFEGEFALLEADGVMLRLPRALVPADAREGDLLTIQIDQERTTARRAMLKQKMQLLFEEDPTP